MSLGAWWHDRTPRGSFVFSRMDKCMEPERRMAETTGALHVRTALRVSWPVWSVGWSVVGAGLVESTCGPKSRRGCSLPTRAHPNPSLSHHPIPFFPTSTSTRVPNYHIKLCTIVQASAHPNPSLFYHLPCAVHLTIKHRIFFTTNTTIHETKFSLKLVKAVYFPINPFNMCLLKIFTVGMNNRLWRFYFLQRCWQSENC